MPPRRADAGGRLLPLRADAQSVPLPGGTAVMCVLLAEAGRPDGPAGRAARPAAPGAPRQPPGSEGGGGDAGGGRPTGRPPGDSWVR